LKTLKLYNSKIKSDFLNISLVVDVIIGKLIVLCCNEEESFLYDTKLILNELITNAIMHGNKCNEEKDVKIMVAILNEKYVFLSIRDEGEGFCYEKVAIKKEMDLSDCGCLSENGRGMQIVRCLCDRVKFNKKGNKIVVIKRITI